MGRKANSKLIGIKDLGGKLSVVSLCCETDFVSGTDVFQNFLNELVLNNLNPEGIDKNEKVNEGLKQLIAKTQENCVIGENTTIDYSNNDKESTKIIGTYLHNSPRENIGTKGSIVVLKTNDNNLDPLIKNQLKDLANNIAMQVVASNPKFLNKSSIPEEVKQSELQLITDSLKSQNSKDTPSDKLDKIAKSKLNSFFDEITLTEQEYVIISHEDEEEGSSSGNKKMKVSEVLNKKCKDLKLNSLEIGDFKLFL
jgi:elongation factor Ts